MIDEIRFINRTDEALSCVCFKWHQNTGNNQFMRWKEYGFITVDSISDVLHKNPTRTWWRKFLPYIKRRNARIEICGNSNPCKGKLIILYRFIKGKDKSALTSNFAIMFYMANSSNA